MLGQNEEMPTINRLVFNQIKSPEVAAMERYGSYPVNLNVGLPDITIPLYTIQIGQIDFPITLSYHLGGIRVDDIAGWAGLGWKLNATGSISRTKRGVPDETTYGILGNKDRIHDTFVSSIDGKKIVSSYPLEKDLFDICYDVSDKSGKHADNMILYLTNLENNITDAASDIYSYQANRISGSFLYGINSTREMVQVPISDNKITRNINGAGKYDSYEIISDDGTKYVFQDYELSSGENELNYVSNWLLSSIISPNKVDTLKFIYSDGGTYTDLSVSNTMWEGCEYERSGQIWQPKNTDQIGKTYTTAFTYNTEKCLSKIIFRTGEIEFIKSSQTRKDKRDYSLEAIIIKNRAKEQIKKITFEYSHFISNSDLAKKENYRLKLNRLKIWGKDQSNPQIYSFTYNETYPFPAYVGLQAPITDNYRGQDLWGYYNGVSNNKNLVGILPDIADKRLKADKANRETNEKYMKIGSLTRIDYPTGGYSIFKTEIHKDDKSQEYGGLRIAQIISKANDQSIPITTTYTYEGADVLYAPSEDNTYYNFYYTSESYQDTRLRVIYTSSPLSAIGYYSGSPVVYRKVIKEETCGNVQNGKTIYYYPGAVLYGNTNYTDIIGFVDQSFNYSLTPLSWAMGQPIKEEYYEGYKIDPIKTITYEYATYDKKWLNSKGIKVNTLPVGVGVYDRHKKFYNDQTLGARYPNDRGKDGFSFSWLYTTSGCKKLKKKIETIYSSQLNKSIITDTEYNYENILSETKPNLLITKKVIMDSKEQSVVEKYQYPQDFTDSISKGMTLNNMLNYPISLSIHNRINGIEKEKSKQKRIYNIKPQPIEDLSSSGGAPLETRIIYKEYDTYGNPQSIIQDDAIQTVYLWSYKGQYPIAEIKNATTTEVNSALSAVGLVSIDALSTNPNPDKTKLDKLRTLVALDKALITTYTYQPLVGILESTDPSGITTHYEYDNFNRLKRTYIKEGTVERTIQNYNYNYINK